MRKPDSSGLASLAIAALTLLVVAGQAAPIRSTSSWVATWGAAMMAADFPGAGPGFTTDTAGLTLREVVHTSVGGRRARIWLSNRFGTQPLHIGAVHIALSANQSGIVGVTDHVLTFNHQESAVVPAGAEIASDPVAFQIPPLTDIDVSIYFSDHSHVSTVHADAQQTSYAANGNVVSAPSLAGRSKPIHCWYVLTGVDVDAPGDSAVIAFGDSITDGWQSTPDGNRRWTDDLAKRLAANIGTNQNGVLGVVNAGISGNRVLQNDWGPNGVSRVGRDILARDGARYVILLEGINDIGRFAMDHRPYGDFPRLLEAGIAQIALQAHLRGMKVIGGTLTPYRGSAYYSAAGDRVRRTINEWIRTSPSFDGVADFDKAVRDPKDPRQFAAQFDSGDHLHPDDAGYQVMADAIDLHQFSGAHEP
ncbi:MAG: SGNH/GDSL hydrolase family protein [Gammaproteobacteria bacterium]|nr:SGNH/GDSL hydrolase family protein [Gammaproteobacteria bacterium]MDE2348182.1 SGNH/GDSL hydrolase family protein [Gammaproteobacteria bacterium]